MSATKNEANKL